jgi:hypothetical protein
MRGNTFRTEDILKAQSHNYNPDEIPKTTRNLNKPQQTSGPFVISQKRKGKDKPKCDSPNNELTEDDLKDLRSMGYRV